MPLLRIAVFFLCVVFRFVVIAASGDECVVQPDGTCTPDLWNAVRITEDDSHYVEIAALGLRQSIENGYTKDIEARVQKVAEYMQGLTDATECQLRHELCTYWAVLDECEKNPGTISACHCAPYYISPLFSKRLMLLLLLLFLFQATCR